MLNLNVVFHRFVPGRHPKMNSLKLNALDEQHLKKLKKELDLDWIKVVDIYVDQQDTYYETATVLVCIQLTINRSDYPHKGRAINIINIDKLSFEHGKLVKMVQFVNEIVSPIPSPFENTIVGSVNIK